MTMGSPFSAALRSAVFALQKTRLARANGFLVAFDREFILLFARDAVISRRTSSPVMPM